MQCFSYCGELFSKIARKTSRAMGHPVTFALSVALIVAWALVGPRFQYSDTWQLVINTSTTIITFLMVFLIQSTQNRDSAAVQIKLDEIIRAISGARNEMLDLEEMTDAEIDEARAAYLTLAQQAKVLCGRKGKTTLKETVVVSTESVVSHEPG